MILGKNYTILGKKLHIFCMRPRLLILILMFIENKTAKSNLLRSCFWLLNQKALVSAKSA